MHIQRRRGVIIALVVGGGILAILIGFGIYGLLRGPAPAPKPASPASSTTNPPTDAPIAQPRQLTVSANSEAFARASADALFRWDTRSSSGPSEWAQVLVDAGDPAEVAGLASDVRGYLPTIEQWEHLREYGTRQWLTIDSVHVPAAWTTAVAQAAPGQLPPGAIAFTISGTRHRSGHWQDQPVASENTVDFTVFLACPLAQECRLLRLSRLNEPLK